MRTWRRQTWLSFMVLALFILTALGAAQADDYHWNTTLGNWDVSTNWNPEGPPTLADDAFIDNGGTAVINSGMSAGASNLFLGDSNSGTVQHDEGSLEVANTLTVGWNNDGNYNLSGGSVQTGSLVVENLGYGWGGTFNQTGGNLNVTNDYTVKGVVYQSSFGNASAGQVNVYGLYGLSDNASLGTNELNVYGRFWQAGSSTLYVWGLYQVEGAGSAGSGEVFQDGGWAWADSLIIAPSNGGSYTMWSGSLMVFNQLTVGDWGSGQFNQDDGYVWTQRLVVGQNYNGHGDYYLNGG